MQTQFDVELWVNTTGTSPDAKAFKTVAACGPYAAVQEALQRVRKEDPEVNAAKIDTWVTEVSLD